MQSFESLMQDMAKAKGTSMLALHTVNHGGSVRQNYLKNYIFTTFSDEQITALEESFVVGLLTDLPENMRTPQDIHNILVEFDIQLIEITWKLFKANGEIEDFNITSFNIG